MTSVSLAKAAEEVDTGANATNTFPPIIGMSTSRESAGRPWGERGRATQFFVNLYRRQLFMEYLFLCKHLFVVQLNLMAESKQPAAIWSNNLLPTTLTYAGTATLSNRRVGSRGYLSRCKTSQKLSSP